MDQRILVKNEHRLMWAFFSWATAVTVFAAGLMTATFSYREEAARKERDRAAMVERHKGVMSLLESTSHGFLVLDKRARVVEWNRALELWTGWRETDMIGRRVAEILSAESAARHAIRFSAIVRSEPGKMWDAMESIVLHKTTNEPVRLVVSARLIPSTFDPEQLYVIGMVERDKE